MEKKLEIKCKKYRGDTMVISARVPCGLVERLDEIAEQTGKNRNEIVGICLEYAVDNSVITEE